MKKWIRNYLGIENHSMRLWRLEHPHGLDLPFGFYAQSKDMGIHYEWRFYLGIVELNTDQIKYILDGVAYLNEDDELVMIDPLPEPPK